MVYFKRVLSLLVVVCVVVLLQPLYVVASETIDTACQLSKGQFRSSLYISSFEEKPSFQIVTNNKLEIGDQVFDSGGKTETERQCFAKGTRTVLKFSGNPFGGLTWFGKIGAGDYSLEIPSLNDVNKLETAQNGLIAGFGIRYQVFPQTLFTYGICVDLGITQSEYDFRVFSNNNSRRILDETFTSTEIQAGLTISRHIKSFEPYAGFKINRNHIKLSDNASFDFVDGYKDSINLFIGSRLNIYPMEWLILEANFLSGLNLSMGIGVGF